MNFTIPKDIIVRPPMKGELDYFKKNPSVAGMASEDNAVVLNPFSTLTPDEMQSVLLNEAARVVMRNPDFIPNFKLTKDQEKFLKGTTYKEATEIDKAATIAARLLSGDPSAGEPTEEQLSFVNKLRNIFFPPADTVVPYSELKKGAF
jgi:hypothetical protein